MNDTQIVGQIEALVGRPVPHQIDDGICRSLDLTSPDYLYHGLIRHHSPADQQSILLKVCELRGLRKLDLRRNLLGKVPDALGDLVELEHLVLGSNYLGSVPQPVARLRRLKSLHLGNNDLTKLPSFVGELTELEYLALHKNLQLKDIEAARFLKKLRLFNLYFVNLNTLPEWVFELKELITLTLWNVSRLNGSLDQLPKIEFLSLCGTPAMRALPDGITRATSLRMCRLFQNNLESLPEDLGNLRNLEQISFYQNQLTALPESMARLDRLEKLNLGWNRFRRMPDWVTRLPKLRWLGIFGNPLEDESLKSARDGLTLEFQWPFTTGEIRKAA